MFKVDIDLAGALVLVSCGKRKLPDAAPAKEIYVSPMFQMTRRLIENQRADWRILSAKHGLLEPGHVIEPYDRTLNRMSAVDRRKWAEDVWHSLRPLASRYERVVIFAGQRYREFLVPFLERCEITFEVPLARMRIGEQLSWLKEHS